MIYWLICKLRQTKLKSRLKGNFKHIEFAGNIEVTSPETVHLSDYLYVGPNCKMYGRGNLNISSNCHYLVMMLNFLRQTIIIKVICCHMIALELIRI